ncbi:hypothetical protein D3C80_1934550 [compost metagenome]
MSQLAQLQAETCCEFRVCIDAGTHRRAALCQRLQRRLQILQMTDVGLELLRPAIEHLAHAHRHGVHQVGASGFDVVMHLFSLALDHLYQVRQRRQQ